MYMVIFIYTLQFNVITNCSGKSHWQKTNINKSTVALERHTESVHMHIYGTSLLLVHVHEYQK